jgi:hypothetical protein
MSDGMNSHIIEMSLFYSWLQLALSLRGKDPIIFEKNIDNFQYKDEAVKIINNFDKTFNDTTSNKNMLELEDNIQKIERNWDLVYKDIQESLNNLI